MDPSLTETVTATLRESGAAFALVFGSRATGDHRPDSDLDVAAWWPEDPPDSWNVILPENVDLVVLNTAPLWLTGRVALHGEVLFDDAPSRRIEWQADTRLIYLDEIEGIRARQREWAEAVSGKGSDGAEVPDAPTA